MKVRFVMNLYVCLFTALFLLLHSDVIGQGNAALDSVPSYSTLVDELLEYGAQNEMFPGISMALYSNDSIHYF